MTFRLRCSKSCDPKHYQIRDGKPEEFKTAEAARGSRLFGFDTVVEVTYGLRWYGYGEAQEYRSAAADGSFSDRAGAQRFASAEAARESFAFRMYGFGHGEIVPDQHGYKVVRLTRVVKP